ncbi:MAG: AraC family transcriptional regulator [Planctomycetota bacterium]|nr:AraC family transcriptional regulator [Planctomycetota bacterium]
MPLRSPESAPLRELGAIHAGLSDLRGEYWMGRPNPGFHLLLYTLGGRGRLTLPAGRRWLEPGDLFLAGARAPYHYAAAKSGWRILWFHFREGVAWEELRGGAARVRQGFFMARLEAAMEGWFFESVREGPAAAHAAGLYVRLLVQYLRRELESHDDPRRRELRARLFALWEHVERDLARPWSVAELAARMHCSPGHLHRLCLAQQDLTPRRAIARLRIQRAQELLAGTPFPLKQIAAQVGYANEFAFSNAFKREMGLSPKAYRARR